MSQESILTLTVNPAVDKSALVSRVEPESKLRCHSPVFNPGGGGLNVARAIHNLGGHARAFYMAGGPTGDIISEFLDRSGVKHQCHPIREWSRENLTVVEEKTRRQFRFGMPGPGVSAQEWKSFLRRVLNARPAPRWLVASGSLTPGVPDRFYADLASSIKGRDIRLIVDTSGAPLKALLKSRIFMLKVNVRELSELSGRRLENHGQIERAGLKLTRQGICRVCIVSLGADGALMAAEGMCTRFQSPRVPVRSVIGAGDSMLGGIVLTLARGGSLQDAVRFGVAAGTAAVITPGTQLCRRVDTERLLKRVAIA